MLVLAAVHLMYVVNGAPVPVAWPANAFPIRYVVESRVDQSFPKGVIDNAIHDWTAVDDANISFQNGGVVTGAKAGKDGQNSITFVDDLFANQNFLAVTTNWYDNSGRVSEADIQIDPSVVSQGYNLQHLVEHEVGHLLGLDHSGVLSSVMYPFVGRGGIAQLDSDDRVGIANLYPRNDPATTTAKFIGKVTGDDGGVYAAQVVALNDMDEPVATVLTDNQGEFEIDGVPPGTYQLYAEPLDGPVDVRNLAGIWQTAKTVSFPTSFAGGGPLHVEAGRIYGNLVVNASGTTTLNPRWIGITAAGNSNIGLSCMPVTVSPGQSVNIAVGGDGFTSGMTTFEIPNPSFQRVSDFTYAGNYMMATFNVSPTAPSQSLVILVKSGRDEAALTGALRVSSQNRTRPAHR